MSFLNRGAPLLNLSPAVIGLLVFMVTVMLAREMDQEVIRVGSQIIPAFDYRWGLLSPKIIPFIDARLDTQMGWPHSGWVTYIFVHSGWFHLLGNAIALVSFGGQIERLLGTGKFLLLFGGAAIASAAAEYFLNANGFGALVGASGGVSGLIGTAFFFTPPSAKLMLYYVIPIPIRLGIVLLVIFHIAMLAMGAGAIAWLSHLAGFACGTILGVLLYDPQQAGMIWRQGINWRTLW